MKSKSQHRLPNTRLGVIALTLLAALALSGCAGNKMALESKGGAAKLKKPVGIFTVRTENAYKPSYEAELRRVKVVSNATRGETAFATSKPYKQEKNQYLEYLVSVDLDPGSYELGRAEGLGRGFLISGHFEFPVKGRFELADGITYLGHVKMINRERKAGEERSGGVLPLLDQSVCGFSGGTFDVTIIDRGETDIAEFVRAYPWLKEVQIKKAIMMK